ncbi:MAG: hypothetical protein ACJ0RO_04140 [Candidatus Neomarinimicrobiota bacterium]|tara:strand:- start:64 stop:444 length:381 start_codon:yes stop_codon:yes gene_type:complete
MESINKNWKSIFLFSIIFFVLGYLVGNNFKEHKPIGGFFISEDIMGMDHIENISGEHKNEHIIIKKFNNGEGTIDVDVNIDDEMDIDKIIKEAEGNPNMIIKIDSTSKNGKKEVRIEVKKEIHSKH